LPALAASSPITGARKADWIDNRLAVYRTNSAKIPSLTGRVIPEAVFSETAYIREIFEPLYRDIAPFDPEEVLRDEFLNSRGAIARVSRGSIEIRVLDLQECPMADIAIASVVLQTTRSLAEQRWTDFASQCRVETDYLESVFLETGKVGGDAVIGDSEYLRMFGIQDSQRVSVSDLWRTVVAKFDGRWTVKPEIESAIQFILARGNLSGRILHAFDDDFSRERMRDIYSEHSDCLASGRLFGAA